MIDKALSRHKRPNEEFRISWDFANDLETGDSITGQAITAKDLSDGSDVSLTFLQGATFSGTKLQVQVQGGTAGRDYDVTLKATTSQGDVFERVVRIRVRS